MTCEWFDDPIFDATVEEVNGKILRGDVWRRYQFLKERAAERGVKGTLVGVNGTTFAAKGVHTGSISHLVSNVVVCSTKLSPTWKISIENLDPVD